MLLQSGACQVTFHDPSKGWPPVGLSIFGRAASFAGLSALARFFEPVSSSMGRAIATLYGANTLGAAFGALLAGYVILPALGLTRSIVFAALASLLVAVVALKVRRQALAAASPSPSPSAAHAAPAAPASSTSQR